MTVTRAHGPDRKTTPVVTKPEAARSVFDVWRLVHWRALRAHLGTTILVALGVALGTTLFAAMVSMVAETGRPFGFGDALARHDIDAVVRPRVVRGLALDTFRDVEATPGVEVAIPIVGGLTEMESADTEQGVLLIGTDCRAQAVIGDYDCENFEPNVDGPGAPLILSDKAAASLGAPLGRPVGFPGGFVGDAHVADIVDTEAIADSEDFNGGFWVVGSIPDVQGLLNTGPFLDRILVRGEPGVSDAIVERVGSSVTVGNDASEAMLFLESFRRMILLAAFVVLGGGLLIAGNTYALAIEQRRRELAIAAVIGLSPFRLVGGLAIEGALIGAVAGLVSVVPAALLGSWFMTKWGSELLSGTGAHVEIGRFVWWLPALCIVGGALVGVVATLPAGLRLSRTDHSQIVRDAPVASKRPIRIRPWWGLLGIACLAIGLAGARLYGKGQIPDLAGVSGGAFLVLGLVIVFFSLAPLGALAVEWIAHYGRAAGLLTAADFGRDPLRWSVVMVLIAIAILGVSFGGLSTMLVSSTAEHLGREVPGLVYALPREVGNQTSANFGDAAVENLRDFDGVAHVSEQHLAVVDTDYGAMNVVGTDPDRPRRNLEFRPQVDTRAVWADVADGDAIVARRLANAESLGVDDAVTIPTPAGPRSLRIAGVADAGWGQDNGIAQWIVVSQERARELWSAPIDSLLIEPENPGEAASVAERIKADASVVGLDTLDTSTIEDQAAANAARFVEPIEWIGWILALFAAAGIGVLIALGLSQRERPRTVLNWIGYSKRLEKRTLAYEILAVAAIGYVLGIIGSWSFALFVAWASPAVLASRVDWMFQTAPLVSAGLAVALIVVIAFAVAVYKANQLSRVLSDRAQPTARPPVKRFWR